MFHVPVVSFGAFSSFGSQWLCVAFFRLVVHWAAVGARRHLSVSVFFHVLKSDSCL